MTENQTTQRPEIPQAFIGEGGAQYTIYPVERFYNGSNGLQDTFVTDASDHLFYIAHKRPELQAFAYGLGAYMAAKDPELARLHFPATRQEVFDATPVALVEAFLHDHSELADGDPNNTLSPQERAFLVTFNLFIGNPDFKAEHVLMPNAHEARIAPIDFDLAFQYDIEPIAIIANKFQTVGLPERELLKKYYDMFCGLKSKDWQAVAAIANEAGYEVGAGPLKYLLKRQLRQMPRRIEGIYDYKLGLPRRKRFAQTVGSLSIR